MLTFPDWDTALLRWINERHHLLLDAVLLPISLAGEVAVFWLALCLFWLVCGKPEQRRMAVLVLVSVIVVNFVFAEALKHLVPRERPYLALEGIRALGVPWESNSFPSGHAHSVWLIAVLIGSRWKSWRWPLVVFALLTCYSRPYFGMHYPTDVLAGAALGLTAGFAIVWVVSTAETQRTRRREKGIGGLGGDEGMNG